MTEKRGVSPAIGVVLLVACVVILASTVAVATLETTSLTDPAPTVARSTGGLEPNDGGDDTGLLRIDHEAGDAVPTKEIELVVDATDACGKRGRLVDLPAGNSIRPPNVEGDDVFDERPPVLGGPAHSALHETGYSAGETLLVRIPDSKCSVRSGEVVVVRVVHTPSNAVLVEKRLTADG